MRGASPRAPLACERPRLRALPLKWMCLALCVALGSRAFAAASPWLAEPGTGYASVSWVSQTADEFFLGEVQMPTPGGADLRQDTLWLLGNYAVSDNIGIDAQVGFASGEFAGPTTADTDSFTGRADSSIGVTWRVVDEVASSLPSMAIRVGAIVAGDYETGHINSLGDGGDGIEASLVVGRFIGDRLGVSAEAGVRDRNNDIPTNYFGNVAAILLLADKVSLGVDYRVVKSEPSLDIGGAGFTPPRFPEVREERQLLGGQVHYNFSDNLTLGLFYLVVNDGRNTPASKAFGGTFTYSFGNL